jgi:hypothetical protein
LFWNDVGEYTNYNFWYIVLFGNGVLIIGAALFFQGKDFIVGLGMVGVMAVIVGSFSLLVVFFPLLLRVCQIMVVALLVLVVSVAASLLVVVVMVAVPIVATGALGTIYSFWILRVTTFGI